MRDLTADKQMMVDIQRNRRLQQQINSISRVDDRSSGDPWLCLSLLDVQERRGGLSPHFGQGEKQESVSYWATFG